MAHSYIQAHDDEAAAFEHFAASLRGNLVLLIDTYDTEAAARTVVRLAPRLRARGIEIKAVRLDSGDLLDHSRRVRAILDAGGLTATGIFCSGGIDETEVLRLLAAGAPIDGFGIGTKLDTSADVPYLECAYKLMEYAGEPRLKKSSGKATYPGRKQVFRLVRNKRMMGDTIGLETERQDGTPLIEKVMVGGKRLGQPEPLPELARRTAEQLQQMPPSLRRLTGTGSYPVAISDSLDRLKEETERRLF